VQEGASLGDVISYSFLAAGRSRQDLEASLAQRNAVVGRVQFADVASAPAGVRARGLAGGPGEFWDELGSVDRADTGD
jgi:hypothetical protein